MELALENHNLSVVLPPIAITDFLLTWERDTTKECTLISWVGFDVNIQHIKPLQKMPLACGDCFARLTKT